MKSVRHIGGCSGRRRRSVLDCPRQPKRGLLPLCKFHEAPASLQVRERACVVLVRREQDLKLPQGVLSFLMGLGYFSVRLQRHFFRASPTRSAPVEFQNLIR